MLCFQSTLVLTFQITFPYQSCMKTHQTDAKLFPNSHSAPLPISYTLMFVAYLAKIFIAVQQILINPYCQHEIQVKKDQVWVLSVG